MGYRLIQDRFRTKTAKIGVIGLGYVGLSLSTEFAEVGFETHGVDIDPEKVSLLNRGKSYILDVSEKRIRKLVSSGLFEAHSDFRIVRRLDAILICVPTPLRKTREPDISHIVGAVGDIKNYLRKGQLVVLESTTYPGTTEELVLPMLEEKGLKVGKDFYLAFSPERVDPANKMYTTRNIPKVVGGVTKQCTTLAATLYSQVVERIISVSSTRVAETVKLLENTFRSTNIALANEFAQMCNKLNVDVWEVIKAAATKPFGFMPFYPGPGLGGHCIPIDPVYLSWKARANGFDARLIDLAQQVNNSMPNFVVTRISQILNQDGKSIKNSKVHLLGVAYKKDVADVRESPALEILIQFSQMGAKLSYTDPYIKEVSYRHVLLKSRPLTKKLLQKCDCCILVTDHSVFDYDFISRNSRLIFDTRNAFGGIRSENIVRL